ncbi:hypothetical protein ACV229_10800 [Burkholderia sp. MR1-5-21]
MDEIDLDAMRGGGDVNEAGGVRSVKRASTVRANAQVHRLLDRCRRAAKGHSSHETKIFRAR